MKRTTFIRKTAPGLAVTTLGLNRAWDTNASAPDPNAHVGFNHIPLQESIHMSNSIIHKAGTRGHANYGWLDTNHTFSFASYYNPERMHFGVLRVLNDDFVSGGKGFGTHPHDNMEIISIPLSGDLEHRDSMNNVAVIKQGDVQIMSAGTGIQHSEYNRNDDREVNFLQIWVFPRERNIRPRYDQRHFPVEERVNRLQQIVSPAGDQDGIDIHQDAWFSLGHLQPGFETDYVIRKKGNGVYAFVISGDVTINEEKLGRRDGMGVWDTERIHISAGSEAELLLMDVPMQV